MTLIANLALTMFNVKNMAEVTRSFTNKIWKIRVKCKKVIQKHSREMYFCYLKKKKKISKIVKMWFRKTSKIKKKMYPLSIIAGKKTIPR